MRFIGATREAVAHTRLCYPGRLDLHRGRDDPESIAATLSAFSIPPSGPLLSAGSRPAARYDTTRLRRSWLDRAGSSRCRAYPLIARAVTDVTTVGATIVMITIVMITIVMIMIITVVMVAITSMVAVIMVAITATVALIVVAITGIGTTTGMAAVTAMTTLRKCIGPAMSW